ncbi:hypothetical protein SRIMM317S_00358 [Streptomyces rimosus subsp. rimosus]
MATTSGTRTRTARAAVTTAAALLLAVTLGPPTARADDPPGVSEDTTAPVKIDPHDPDLRMVQGATLAPAKVLNIKSIVETDDGAERRQDTNANVTFALQAEVLFGKDSAELTPTHCPASAPSPPRSSDSTPPACASSASPTTSAQPPTAWSSPRTAPTPSSANSPRPWARPSPFRSAATARSIR